MKTGIVLTAILITASSSFALAQSSTATSGTTSPSTTTATGAPNGQKNAIPPAARSSNNSIRVGPNAMDQGEMKIKRNK